MELTFKIVGRVTLPCIMTEDQILGQVGIDIGAGPLVYDASGIVNEDVDGTSLKISVD